MRELIKNCTLLTEFEVTVLQLVDMGLCRYSDVKDGTLNLRDVLKLKEYADLKSAYANWQQQRAEAETKARKLWQK